MTFSWLSKYSYAAPPFAMLIVLLLVNASINASFMDHSNLNSLMIGVVPLVMMGMAQAVPVMAGGGGIDLSIGPLVGVVNVVIATKLSALGWTDPLSTLLVVVGIGVASGLLNGVLIAVVRVQPIIATLATFLAYQGLALQIQPIAGGTAPDWLQGLASTYAGIPGLIFFLLAIAVLWIALTRTAYHRNLLAVGGDARAAYTAGVDVTFVRISAHVIAGVLAALVGMVIVGIMGSGDPSIGASFTLTSISAVALGGVSLAGGRGGILGPAFAGAMLFLIQNLFTLAQLSVFYLQIFYGAIVLVALAFNSFGGSLSVRSALKS